MKKTLFLFLSLLLISSGINADDLLIDELSDNFFQQLSVFPQEKIHIHNDKPFYVAGEKIWLRPHLVDGTTHMYNAGSRYVYVELISPLDSIISLVKIKPEENIHYGYLDIPEELPEGNYTIRAYTGYQMNQGEEYFFRKSIRIGSPFSATMRTEADFVFLDDKKLNASIYFLDIATGKKVYPKHLAVRINDGDMKRGKMDKDSVLRFSFDLPINNLYRILYVESDKYMQYIPVPMPDIDFDVAFFPEGGYLLEGINNRIAFKAIKNNGLSVDVTGSIVDDKGNLIKSFETLHKGMGTLEFLPEKGKEYYALCRNENGIEKRFSLPQAVNSYGLKANWVKDKLVVSVLKAREVSYQDELYLIIHNRGMLQYAGAWDYSNEFITFDKKHFPSGVLQILLLDKNKDPISERLVFCMNDDQAKLNFTTDRKNYQARQKVNSYFKIRDNNNNPLEGNFSISVTDDNDVEIDSDHTIKSTLLLSSELKGYIESPGWYFKGENKPATAALDMLMMTQGWRRYNIPEVVRGIFEVPDFPVEVGQEISGLVKGTGIFNRQAKKGVFVSIISPDASFGDVIETDTSGRFVFNGFEYPDSTQYILQATTKNGKTNLELILDRDIYPSVDKLFPIPVYENKLKFDNYIVKAEQKYAIENGMRMIYLDEVVVRGKLKVKNYSPYTPLADKIYDSELIEQMPVSNLRDILDRTAGVRSVNGIYYLRGMEKGFHGGSPPLIVWDGIYIHPNNDKTSFSLVNPSLPNSSTFVYSGFSYEDVNIYDLESVEIVMPTYAVIFGSRGYGGAIVLTSKKGKNMANSYGKTQVFNVRQFTPLGHQKPAEFYSPRYETRADIEENTPDLRTTIYWKPDVRFDNGEAEVEFYSADAATTYSVIIEGITTDGRIIHAVEKISRK